MTHLHICSCRIKFFVFQPPCPNIGNKLSDKLSWSVAWIGNSLNVWRIWPCPQVTSQTTNLITSINSLNTLKLLHGCELNSALELSRLSTLGSLSQLVVAPLMPPAPVLAGWAKGCKQLVSLGVAGQPGPLPLTPAMPGITELQLLNSSGSRSRHGSGTGSVGSSAGGSLSVDLGSLAITLRSPLSLSGENVPSTRWPTCMFLF